MADRRLLLVALCALNHLSLEQIAQTYTLSKAECIQLLVQLDRIGFLELLPNNLIKLRVTRAFSWLPDGPIQQYFKARAQHEYFASSFAGPGELMLVVNGMLSRASNNTVVARLSLGKTNRLFPDWQASVWPVSFRSGEPSLKTRGISGIFRAVDRLQAPPIGAVLALARMPAERDRRLGG